MWPLGLVQDEVGDEEGRIRPGLQLLVAKHDVFRLAWACGSPEVREALEGGMRGIYDDGEGQAAKLRAIGRTRYQAEGLATVSITRMRGAWREPVRTEGGVARWLCAASGAAVDAEGALRRQGECSSGVRVRLLVEDLGPGVSLKVHKGRRKEAGR